MPTLLENREKRANVWAQMQEIRDAVDKDGWTAELRQKWDRAHNELKQLTDDIKRDEDNVELDKTYGQIDDENRDKRSKAAKSGGDGANLEDEYRKAFLAFLARGVNDLDADQRKLLQAQFRPDDQIKAALGAGTGGGGGYTVPEGFWQKVTETMKFFGGVLEAGAETFDTDSGQDIPWPTNDDTNNKGALVAENTQIGEQDMTFGGKTLAAHMYTSRIVRVAFQLLNDSAIDLETFLPRKLGERLGRILNEHWTIGDAAKKPQGFVTGATVGVTVAAAAADADIVDAIIDLVHSVDRAYRVGPGVGFSVHDLNLAKFRKLRDDSGGAGVGRPIWEPSIRVGEPDSLFGRAITVNNDMASTFNAGDKPLAFGSFRAGYVVRRVRGAQMLRLTERFADFLQVGFLGFQRADGLVQDASALKVMELS